MAGFCADAIGLHGRSANPGPTSCRASRTFFATACASAVSPDAISGSKAAGGCGTSATRGAGVHPAVTVGPAACHTRRARGIRCPGIRGAADRTVAAA